MRTVHDRDFIAQYSRIVHWRGVWMSLRALVLGVTAAAAVLAAMLSYRYIFYVTQLVGDDAGPGAALDSILGGRVSALSRVIFYSDWLLYVLVTFVIFAPMVTARFNFWRYMAEAQGLIAAAETAANTSGSVAGAPRTGRTQLQLWVSLVVPAVVFCLWSGVFWTVFAEPGPIRLKAIHATSEPDLFVMEFNGPLSRHRYVDLRPVKSNGALTEDPILEYGFPVAVECRSRWIWLPLPNLIQLKGPGARTLGQLLEDVEGAWPNPITKAPVEDSPIDPSLPFDPALPLREAGILNKAGQVMQGRYLVRSQNMVGALKQREVTLRPTREMGWGQILTGDIRYDIGEDVCQIDPEPDFL